MIAAVMQPYFFPYIGYFQLMKAVDVFVFYDDAQYMKGGWINRNRILVNGEPFWLTLPVSRASLTLPINQRRFLLNGERIGAIKHRLRTSYAKAPAFEEVFPVLDELLSFEDSNVAAFNVHLLTALARTIDITCKFLASSGIVKPTDLRGEAKVIDLCERIGATCYVNPIGGIGLYQTTTFDRAGLQLQFLRTKAAPTQLENGPQHLSIIDRLMADGFAGCAAKLPQYELLSSEFARRTVMEQ